MAEVDCVHAWILVIAIVLSYLLKNIAETHVADHLPLSESLPYRQTNNSSDIRISFLVAVAILFLDYGKKSGLENKLQQCKEKEQGKGKVTDAKDHPTNLRLRSRPKATTKLAAQECKEEKQAKAKVTDTKDHEGNLRLRFRQRATTKLAAQERGVKNGDVSVHFSRFNENSSFNQAVTLLPASFWIREPSLRRELQARWETFSNFPSTACVSAIRLAEAGFYYLGVGDKCKCAFCGVTCENWERGENPLHVHRRLDPTCPFLSTTSTWQPLRLTSLRYEWLGSVHPSSLQRREEEFRNRGNGKKVTPETEELFKRQAVYPTYSSRESRLRSFAGRRPARDDQLPDVPLLIDAGFYFAGYADCVRCFYCGLHLRSWERGDSPAEKHARWRPTCGYLRYVKGDTFVNNVPNATQQAGSTSQHMGDQSGFSVYPGANVRGTRRGSRTLSTSFGGGMPLTASDLNALGIETPDGETNQLTSEELNITPRPEFVASQHQMCQCCLVNPATVTLLPCGHVATCAVCSCRHCPVCGTNVLGYIRGNVWPLP